MWFVPITGCSNGTRVGAEADQSRIVVVAFSDELTDVEFAFATHRGSSRITDMGVMFPDNHFCTPSVSIQVRCQRIQRPCHMLVTQVPRGNMFAEHRAVIFLGIFDQPCVLLGIEKIIFGYATIAVSILGSMLLQLDELVNDIIFTG